MIAMVFAAGVGSRLKPLTDKVPKALVEVNGKPLLLHAFDYLSQYGVTKVVVNVHHHYEQIINFCESLSPEFELIISNEHVKLLDTGGGLKKAASLLGKQDQVIVLNADILTNIPLDALMDEHLRNGNLATLAVRHRNSSRKLIFNNVSLLSGWKNDKTGEVIKTKPWDDHYKELAFCGVQVLSPEIFEMFPDQEVFSTITWYLELSKKQRIAGFEWNNGYWFDIGSVEKLLKAEEALTKY